MRNIRKKSVAKIAAEIIAANFTLQQIIAVLTQHLFAASFVGIRAYTNKFGEVANYVVNHNVSFIKAKFDDFCALFNADIFELFDSLNFERDAIALAFQELWIEFSSGCALMLNADDAQNYPVEVLSYLKGIEVSKATKNRSEGQKNAYTPIGKGVKVHNKSYGFYFYNFVVSKTVLIEGNYPDVDSDQKTIIKNAIKAHLEFKTSKFRNFKIEQITSLKAVGETLYVNDRDVSMRVACSNGLVIE